VGVTSGGAPFRATTATGTGVDAGATRSRRGVVGVCRAVVVRAAVVVVATNPPARRDP